MSATTDSSVTPSDLVVIVDDDPGARHSVATLVQARGLRAQTFASAEDFLESFDRSLKACVILDVRMTGMSGLDLQQQMIDEGIDLPVIVITGFGDVPGAVRAMQAGAVSFLRKPCDPEELWKNIQLGINRERVQRELREQRASIVQNLRTLSGDERQVLDKLIEGLPNKRIARELDIGLRTVELRRSRIMKKLQADSLAELVRLVLTVNLGNAINV